MKPMEPEPTLAARAVTKRFPGVVAVDGVDFDVFPGEIVALLGANGAGKSTLIQVLAGVHPFGSYEGQVRLAGAEYRPRSVAEAEAAGVALVPQEIHVVPQMSVAANLYLHSQPKRLGFIDHQRLFADARRALLGFGLDLDVRAPMGGLDLATQQLVIIVRALSKNARVLILDEPTAALTDDEVQRLFDKLRALRARGVGIVFVSHRLAEVFSISDRIVVMRDGRVCGAFATDRTTRDEVVSRMVGGSAQVAGTSTDCARALGESALRVSRLNVYDIAQPARLRVDDLSFDLAQGEILGLFGLLGSGCTAAALAVYGAWGGVSSGDLAVHGRPVRVASPTDAIAGGIGLIAQDRRDCLLPEHSILDNVLLAGLSRFSRRGLVQWARFRQRAMELARRLDIKAASVDVPVRLLSGGNQQKVQIARWLASTVDVLLLLDPTRGVDVGARAEITRVWRELAAQGYGLLLVSSDAAELVEVCDRVLVLRHGRLGAQLTGPQLNEETLLHEAAGA
jgi:D-xylose transport system ATP-binding protein